MNRVPAATVSGETYNKCLVACYLVFASIITYEVKKKNKRKGFERKIRSFNDREKHPIMV